MRTRTGNILVITIVTLLVIVGAWIAFSVMQSAPLTPDEIEDRTRQDHLSTMTLVDFTATAPDGTPFTRDDLDGSWTVLSFGFTHCQLACPTMHANTIRMMSKTEHTDLKFVTISVDPVHDTPERLAAYTAQLGVEPDRWVFLAIDAEQRDRILDGLSMMAGEDESPSTVITMPDGVSTMSNINHPERFVLIAPDGAIVDMYRAMSGELIDEYTRSIREHMLKD